MLCGILFVLYTGIRWEYLPQELGFGSGMTCWRRLRDWNEAGVWQHLHELLLSELRAADLLDLSRDAVDSSHIRAMKGGSATGPSPPIRGKGGQPLRRPKHLYADRGYDHEVYRDKVRRFQITPHLARRGTGHGSGLGVYRWVVEGTIALLRWFRRPRIRWEIREDLHHAFVTLGCAVICWRRLGTALCGE